MVLDVLVLICFDVGFNIIICFNHFESCYRHVLALDSPGSMATGRLLERSLDLLVSIQLQGWKPAEFWGHVFFDQIDTHFGKQGDLLEGSPCCVHLNSLVNNFFAPFPLLIFWPIPMFSSSECQARQLHFEVAQADLQYTRALTVMILLTVFETPPWCDQSNIFDWKSGEERCQVEGVASNHILLSNVSYIPPGAK